MIHYGWQIVVLVRKNRTLLTLLKVSLIHTFRENSLWFSVFLA